MKQYSVNLSISKWSFIEGTYGHSDVFDRFFGLHTPWSHVPHTLLTFSDQMSFFERLYNTIVSVYDLCLRHWYFLPGQNEIARHYFANVESKSFWIIYGYKLQIILVYCFWQKRLNDCPLCRSWKNQYRWHWLIIIQVYRLQDRQFRVLLKLVELI